MTDTEKLELLCSHLTTRYKDVSAKIRRGQGVWPNQDYVMDYTWNAWVDREHELRLALNVIGWSIVDL